MRRASPKDLDGKTLQGRAVEILQGANNAPFRMTTLCWIAF
jgi:hypothetical protein